MKLTVAEICEIVEGELVGWGDAVVENVAGLDTARAGDVTFAKRDRLKAAKDTKATAVLVPERVEGMEAAQIVVDNPYFAFGKLLHLAEREQRAHPAGIHETAVVGRNARLGEGVALGAHVVIGDDSALGDGVIVYPNTTVGAHVVIGEDSLIYSNVAIREHVKIGKRAVIHSCTSIGGDGFGFLQTGQGHARVPQVGTVEIGDDVNIGCNCTVDRATMDKTVIENGVIIDNHSHIAHNCRIGENSVLVAYARLGGSTILGKNVVLTEDVGVTNGVTIGEGSIVGACAKVSRSWPANSVLLGAPAQRAGDEKRQLVLIKKLPKLYETVKELKRIVEEELGGEKKEGG